MFLPFLSLVNSHMGFLVYAQPELDSEIGAYRVTILQIPDHIISKDTTRYFWGVFGSYSLCLRRFSSGVFAFIYIIYRNESKLLKTVFKTYGNIYIMRQFKWGIMIILPYFLSNGGGVGENDKRSYLKRKCRTLEYSLNARSFTLAGFAKESFIAFVKYISKKYRRVYNNTTVFRL